MKAVDVKALQPGNQLAKPIIDSYGRVLLQKDVIFTERLIRRLKEFDFKYVFIEDAYSENIEPQSIIDEELRIETISKIRKTFKTFDQFDATSQNQYVLERSIDDIKDTVHEIANTINHHDEILSIMSDIFMFDDYLYNHSINVTVYTLVLAKELQFSDKEIEEIGIGAMLHDIGKIKVPKSIINKPDQLSDIEFDVVKEHTTYGYEMLKKFSNIPSIVAFCAYQHHERLDGSGYPLGLKEANIHEYAKIMAVSDVFDAVTSNRVYRNAFLPHEGLEILYSGSDSLFSKKYIELFRKHVSIYPNGSYVELNDGRRGIIAKQSKIPDRPIIRILEEEKLRLTLSELYEVDLSEHSTIMITKCNTTPF
ncbi:HD-GYP domain-containing protein [Tenuibacillus multivorans]|uniref:HDIG domain-containing protein n=1 Tax=Tenuibacillus multivorans TaxID=237069 RepID=A0A1H0FUJ7_9BACI|nr:HD-GYP domain-containing protein [Tenuibacillus multivorans]GEL77871.1 phosphohydrolase [Tenuibacillus multivorans]SDN98305.1 HDIG domain-containing protein [Tenuibacillus multivorans]